MDKCAKSLQMEHYDVEFEGYRSADPERRVLSSKKLRERTGWCPRISLEEGIDMCVKHHLELGE